MAAEADTDYSFVADNHVALLDQTLFLQVIADGAVYSVHIFSDGLDGPPCLVECTDLAMVEATFDGLLWLGFLVSLRSGGLWFWRRLRLRFTQ